MENPVNNQSTELERYGHVSAWAKELGISARAIQSRIADIQGVSARCIQGRILENAFYPESLIRERCADLLRELPRADSTGRVEIDGIFYRSVGNWADVLSISPATIRRRVDEASIVGITARDATGQIWESTYFSETDVMRLCTDAINIPSANKEGFYLDEDGIEWGTGWYFSKKTGIARQAISARLDGCRAMTARDPIGRILINAFYAEPDVIERCNDLLSNKNQANDEGFVIKEGKKFAAIPALSREIGVSEAFLNKILKDVRGITAKNASGMLLDGGFHDIEAVRELCAHVTSTPLADEKGVFELHTERYASVTTWGREFSLSPMTVVKYLRMKDAKGISGRNYKGKFLKDAFFSESQVRTACGELINELPETNSEGYFEIDSEKYRTAKGWGTFLGASHTGLAKKMAQIGVAPVKGKAFGQIADFYPETKIREVADVDGNPTLPRASEDGFFTEGEIRWGTVRAWSNEISITSESLKKMLAGKQARTARVARGQAMKDCFYSELDVREVIQEWAALPTADDNHSFLMNGERYGMKIYWATVLGVSPTTITNRLIGRYSEGITGKERNGKVHENSYYSLSLMREVCNGLVPTDLV